MESISVTVINFVLMMLMFETCCSRRMQPSVLFIFLLLFFVNIVFKVSIFDNFTKKFALLMTSYY